MSTTTIKQALRYAEHLSASGGTEILSAVRQALKSPPDSARLQQIILLTDGQVGNEEELSEFLHQHVGSRRLFTIGIGSTPNSYLMRKTAELGHGTFTYIGNVNEVKEKLDGLFKKLERPVLHAITMDRTAWTGLEQYPSHIADLYEGEPIVLAIKTDSLPSEAILQGQTGTQSWTLPVSFKTFTTPGGLAVHWARQKISALMDEPFKSGSDDGRKKRCLMWRSLITWSAATQVS